MQNHATEVAVRQRYSEAARARENELCCPTDYDPQLLELLPQEIVEKDYGCGNPSEYARQGETVLDLGSGAGKICYICSQIVGPTGNVIGIDMNDDMLSLARRYQSEVADRIGYSNVRFCKARIQDLTLDREKLDCWIQENPVMSESDLLRLEAFQERLRLEHPLITDSSVDLVVSNCVLNLVPNEQKSWLFEEIHRVLLPGGRAVISDIVCDEELPEDASRDPELWSGCLSGAMREDKFLGAFEKAGFYGIELAKRSERPWKTIEGVEFRSVTVIAYKGKEGECWDHNEAVVYRGPFREVVDDDGHSYRRGDRVAVCRKTFNLLQREPYRLHFEAIRPISEISSEEAQPFRCTGGVLLRSPRATKGLDYSVTEMNDTCCEPGGCC